MTDEAATRRAAMLEFLALCDRERALEVELSAVCRRLDALMAVLRREPADMEGVQ